MARKPKAETALPDGGIPFSELIAIASGEDRRATLLLADLARSVRATSKKGTMTLTVTLEEQDTASHELGVRFGMRINPPSTSMTHSFYSHENGAVGKDPEDHLFTGTDAERDSDGYA